MTRHLLVLFLAAAAARAQSTDADGVLAADTEWSGEILLLEDVIVPRGVTLTIAPGTRIVLAPRARGRGPGWNDDRLEIHVAGAIKARGRPESPIRFGCSSDKKRHADGDRLWLGIVMLPGRTMPSRFDWCTFENADAALQVAGRHVRLENCLIRDCTVGIASILRASPTTLGVRYFRESVPRLKLCLFVNCRIAVGAEGNARPDLEQCVFLDCGAGIQNASFGRTVYPLSGVGPRVHRCEFLRCQVAVEGSSRITSSIFEGNGVVFNPSFGHDPYTSTIDRYLRSHNLYSDNTTITSGDVPLGEGATFKAPARQGSLPAHEDLDALDLFQKGISSILALTRNSPGVGAGLGGGDVGAFGRRGRTLGVTTYKPPKGLILDTWLACGPPGSPTATDPKWARLSPRAGQASNDAVWVVVYKADHPIRMPGLKLVALPLKPRTLVAYVDSATAQKASLGLALDGTASASWNGSEIFSDQRGTCRFQTEITCAVSIRKGRNRLVLRVTPSGKSARLRARLITAEGGSPEGAQCVRPESKFRAIRVISVKRNPVGEHVLALKIRLSDAVHWEDALDWRRYLLVDPNGLELPLPGSRIEYDPKQRLILITRARLDAKGRFRLKLGRFRDVFGVWQDIPDSSHTFPNR